MATIQLYNSLTRTVDPFVTCEPGVVRMYTCGPTVYHYAHIGNLRTYLMEDVLDRFFRWSGYDVRRIMNITDVGHLTSDADTGEDKMLAGARREHKTVLEIAKFYTDAFFEDCRKLRIRRPDVVQPATGCVPEMIRLVEGLLEKGFAYEAGGNIYFDTSKLPNYHVFLRHREENLEVGVREGVSEDGNKRNKGDFVLWFTKSKFEDQELKWESPWGLGYPGWHIECSAIAIKYGGERLDLHCGGIDNQFPHHTNEIAQSEAYLGHPWCPQWFHVHHLTTEGGKMSKSSGEFLTLSLLEEKGYSAMDYRFFCLQSHYRRSLLFSYPNLDNAKSAYRRLVERVASVADAPGEPDGDAVAAWRETFASALGDDLNPSLALTVLYDLLKSAETAATKRALVASFDEVLSLGLLDGANALRDADAPAADGEEDARIRALLDRRAEAKKAKNFAEADAIRDQLKAEGIQIIDTPQGAVWKKL